MSHALVVGGTRGLGREVACRLAADGHQLTVLSRAAPTLELAPGTRHVAADLASGDLDAAVAQVLSAGPLRYVVCCQRFRGPADTWDGELATGLTATRRLLDRLAPEFEPEGDRAVVLIGSIAGRLVSEEQGIGYHVVKAGLVQMARYYAVRLGPAGIRVNCVSPSLYVKEETRGFLAGRPELMKLYAELTPLRRMGSAAEVAEVVRFLCSPAASFVTGQELTVDGGMSLVNPPALARKLTGLEP